VSLSLHRIELANPENLQGRDHPPWDKERCKRQDLMKKDGGFKHFAKRDSLKKTIKELMILYESIVF